MVLILSHNLEIENYKKNKNLLTLNDENQQAPLKDPLHVPVGPITRARFKKEDEGVINLIQAIDRADLA